MNFYSIMQSIYISEKWLELPLNRKTLLPICFNTVRFLRYLSRVFLARKKNSCYFCDFCDICGHFGALLGFFAF